MPMRERICFGSSTTIPPARSVKEVSRSVRKIYLKEKLQLSASLARCVKPSVWRPRAITTPAEAVDASIASTLTSLLSASALRLADVPVRAIVSVPVPPSMLDRLTGFQMMSFPAPALMTSPPEPPVMVLPRPLPVPAKLPVPVYGEVPPPATTVTVVLPPLQRMAPPAVAVAVTGSGEVTVMPVTPPLPTVQVAVADGGAAEGDDDVGPRLAGKAMKQRFPCHVL